MTLRSSAVAKARETAFAPAHGNVAFCAGVAGAAMPMPGGAPSATASRGEARVTVEMTGVVTLPGRRLHAPTG